MLNHTCICEAIDENEFSIGMFFDLLKAFNTANQDISISRLQHHDIRGTNLQWSLIFNLETEHVELSCSAH